MTSDGKLLFALELKNGIGCVATERKSRRGSLFYTADVGATK
jgi:hypothetical protein